MYKNIIKVMEQINSYHCTVGKRPITLIIGYNEYKKLLAEVLWTAKYYYGTYESILEQFFGLKIALIPYGKTSVCGNANDDFFLLAAKKEKINRKNSNDL
jgi:hypothetical protein